MGRDMALLLALLCAVPAFAESPSCTSLRDDCEAFENNTRNSAVNCTALFANCSLVQNKDRIPRKDVIAAGMLMAFVSYMMATVWLINHPDPGLHKQIWAVIHTQTSIFIAVMMYQAIKGVVPFLPEEAECEDNMSAFLFNAGAFFMFFLAWVVALHLITVSLVWEHTAKWWQIFPWSNPHGKKAQDKRQSKTWEIHRERLLLFWGMVMGHTVGFSAIDSFAYIQCMLPGFNDGCPKFIFYFGGVGVAIAAVLIVFRCFRKLRDTLKPGPWVDEEKTTSASSSPLIRPDADQENLDDVWKRWADTVEETEEDAIALAVSFLLCQAFRVMIDHRTIPHVDGTEAREEPASTGPLEVTHFFSHAVELWLAGVIVYLGVFLFNKLVRGKFHGVRKELSGSDNQITIRRAKTIAMDIGSMGIAWTSYFAMYWFLDTLNTHLQHTHPGTGFNCGSGGMTGLVCLAMVATATCYFIIFIIRKLNNHFAKGGKSMSEGEERQSVVSSVLKATGLIIGFAWEKCFDTAVEDITNASHSEGTHEGLPHELARLFMAICIAALVGEVWRRYMILELMSSKNEEEVARDFKKLTKREKVLRDLTEPGSLDEKTQSELATVKKELAKSEEFDEFMTRHEAAYYDSRRNMRQLLNPGNYTHPDRNKRQSSDHEAVEAKFKGDDFMARAARYNHMQRIVELAESMADYDVHFAG